MGFIEILSAQMHYTTSTIESARKFYDVLCAARKTFCGNLYDQIGRKGSQPFPSPCSLNMQTLFFETFLVSKSEQEQTMRGRAGCS
jgi:hypothetical protein